MTSSRALLALVLLGTAAIGSCETTGGGEPRSAFVAPERQLAAFERIAAKPPSAPLAGETDYRAVAEAMRGVAPMTVGSYVPEASGVVARNVVFAFGGNFEAGLKIAELRLYGVDPAQLAGGGTESSMKIAARIDARGLSSFGLEHLLEKATSAYMDAIIGAMDGPGPEELSKELRQSSMLDRYVLSAGQVVADGLVLHTAEPAPAAAKSKGFGAAIEAAARFSRLSSFDALVIRDLKNDFASGGPGAGTAMTMSTAFAGWRGWRRGDLDETMMSGVKWSMASTSPAAAGAPPLNMDMTGSVDSLSASGIRLAKLFDYWSRGATPPPSETALMSLGVWRTKGERHELGGAPYYSVEETVTDLSQFRWLLPTAIKVSARNLSYDFTAVLKMGAASAESLPEVAKPQDELSKTIAALERHGLARFDMPSLALDYAWAPESGATTFSGASDVARIARLEHRFDAVLPDFDAFAALAPKAGGTVDQAALTRTFAAAALKSFTARIVDQGVLDSGFAFAADMQAESAGAPPGSVNPADLRAAAALGLRATSAASPVGGLMIAVADFVAEGGTLTISARPKKPIPFAEIGQPGPNGENPVDRLGLKAERTP